VQLEGSRHLCIYRRRKPAMSGDIWRSY